MIERHATYTESLRIVWAVAWRAMLIGTVPTLIVVLVFASIFAAIFGHAVGTLTAYVIGSVGSLLFQAMSLQLLMGRRFGGARLALVADAAQD